MVKIRHQAKKKIKMAGIILFGLLFALFFYEIYIPADSKSTKTFTYTVKKGEGAREIASNLSDIGAIKNAFFFELYVNVSMQRNSLKAGNYIVSPKMSAYQITRRIARGDVLENRIVIYEGWDAKDIGGYLESKNVCQAGEFDALISRDYSSSYDFLKDKPKTAGLEGYLFPDTYEVSEKETCQSFVNKMLKNFGQKFTPELKAEIAKQKKSIFDVVIMASMIEKEVRSMEEKKIVSGILWKRLSVDMPLQLDSTVNYVTGKNDPGVAIRDTKIDSPYNTYKYKGLPKGPISSPGVESIQAALYPTATKFWFYLSNGKTYFSETLDQHNAYKAKYLD